MNLDENNCERERVSLWIAQHWVRQCFNFSDFINDRTHNSTLSKNSIYGAIIDDCNRTIWKIFLNGNSLAGLVHQCECKLIRNWISFFRNPFCLSCGLYVSATAHSHRPLNLLINYMIFGQIHKIKSKYI